MKERWRVGSKKEDEKARRMVVVNEKQRLQGSGDTG